MTHWSWDPSLSVGVDVVDSQHHRIIDYINELDVARREKDQAKVTQVLIGLVDYMKTHFAFEEELMRQAGYPLTDLHRRAHDAFIARMRRFVEEHGSGKDISRKLGSELQIWLTNHIKNHDRDYAPYAARMLKKGSIASSLARFFG